MGLDGSNFAVGGHRNENKFVCAENRVRRRKLDFGAFYVARLDLRLHQLAIARRADRNELALGHDEVDIGGMGRNFQQATSAKIQLALLDILPIGRRVLRELFTRNHGHVDDPVDLTHACQA